ncbi:TrmH family RNA methyltransferase [Gardnerella sp. DNF01199S]|uniref:TrmH family RNA methyltransferase n=1 Tax=Gardnerella sp. DNF01199S TaxID=2749067 RepID=UPI003BA904D4
MPLKELIDNAHSDRVKRICAISRAKSRGDGRFLVEGPQSVREAVRYVHKSILDIYVLQDAVNSGSNRSYSSVSSGGPIEVIAKIVDESLKNNCYVHPATAEVMRKISTDCQGIVALCDSKVLDEEFSKEFNKIGKISEISEISEIDEISEIEKEVGDDAKSCNNKDILIASCWQVRDPGNAGAIIRVADVAGCNAVVFVDDCVSRFNSKLVRSSAGSLFHLPVVKMSENEWFDWAKNAKIKVIAADIYGTENKKPKSFASVLDSFRNESNIADNVTSNVAILFGNEARGLPQEVLNKVDEISVIPIYGKAESMNLATSAAVMLMGLAMSSHERKMGI